MRDQDLPSVKTIVYGLNRTLTLYSLVYPGPTGALRIDCRAKCVAYIAVYTDSDISYTPDIRDLVSAQIPRLVVFISSAERYPTNT